MDSKPIELANNTQYSKSLTIVRKYRYAGRVIPNMYAVEVNDGTNGRKGRGDAAREKVSSAVLKIRYLGGGRSLKIEHESRVYLQLEKCGVAFEPGIRLVSAPLPPKGTKPSPMSSALVMPDFGVRFDSSTVWKELSDAMKNGQRAIGALQRFHQTGYVHRRLSPSTILINSAGQVNFVGLSACDRYLDESKRHVSFEAVSEVAPSGDFDRLFTAKDLDYGFGISRSHDVVSLAYVIVHQRSGGLPWSITESLVAIRRLKRDTSVKKLCKKCKDLIPFVAYAYGLAYNEEPDYQKMIELLEWRFEKKLPIGDMRI